MKNLALVLAFLALPLAAQEQKKEEPKEPQVQKLFVLKYADPQQVNNLIRVFTANTNPDASMHAIAVSATPEAMAAIEDAIKRLDVPGAAPQNVEMTAYLLIGSQTEGAPQTALPKDLESVLTQLKAAFAYKSYTLGDVLTLRGRTDRPLNSLGAVWSAPMGNASLTFTTDFSVRGVAIGGDGTIRIDGLAATNKVQGSKDFTRITTDLDMKDGQKVVVGKMGMNPNEAMFVVLTAHVAQ
jgi:hypothetical protein